jgi:hypothetical protein
MRLLGDGGASAESAMPWLRYATLLKLYAFTGAFAASGVFALLSVLRRS